MSYSIRVISSTSEFEALGGTWDGLVADAVDANTFLTHAWLYSWWSAYRPAGELRIVLAERGGRVCGIAPMMLVREGGAGRVLRRLRFIGDGTSETDHMNFIVQHDDRRQILLTLLNSIDALPWDVAHFSQIPQRSENTLQLLEHAADRGWLLDRREVPCPQRSMPSSYEELVRSLPSRLRTSIRSARRELEAKHTVQFGHHTKHDELSEALTALYRNHAGRWQAKGESGVFVNDRKRDFYAALSRRLLDAGALRFFYLKLDGKVVAQQFCFEHAGTVMLLQEGFDFDFSKLNVGNVLRAMVFEHLISSGTRTYDFLAGKSRHKQAWSDSVSNDLDIRACRPSIAGKLAFYLPRWWKRARQSRASREGVPS